MTTIKPGSTIGIIGGGQLGRMSANAASRLGYKTHIFTDSENGPASHVANKTTIAEYTDMNALGEFARSVDVVTFEFENIPHESVEKLDESAIVRPSWKILHIAQNRLREKNFMNSIDIGTALYKEVTSGEELQKAHAEIGTKCILKTVEFGYDGKGQFKIDESTDCIKLWDEINIGTGILEGMVTFEKEISVIVARGEDGVSVPFAPIENIHKDGILDTSTAPANISVDTAKKAEEMAKKIADSLELVGLIAIEMFLSENGALLVNEIAPRPHNSGHLTADACVTSQFEQFIRAVCGLPLGNPSLHSNATMKNLIGEDIHQWEKYIFDPNSKIHLYGKENIRAGRKMGHITQVSKK